MTSGLEALARMDYPGRFIIIGRDKSGLQDIVVYGITGRSPASQARKFVWDKEKYAISVQPTDKKILLRGNPDLLIYPAIIFRGDIAVSNGKQTEAIADYLSRHAEEKPLSILEHSLKDWSFEPDHPTFTPRISGCITDHGAGIAIIKRSISGACTKEYYQALLHAGKGSLLATYQGQNIDPLPAFSGKPIEVALEGSTSHDIAEEVYARLGDLKVGVAVVLQDKYKENDVAIINRHTSLKKRAA
ncbi:MAG: IMP cyclohydrolase [Nanoarchaeota archaeon]